MAKTRVNPEAEELLDGAMPSETPIEKEKEDAADRNADEVVLNTGKKVTIHTVDDVDCIVAGTPYKMAKDKTFKVPSDVAAILTNAKKAYRL